MTPYIADVTISGNTLILILVVLAILAVAWWLIDRLRR